MRFHRSLSTLLPALLLVTGTEAGPIGYALCQGGCATVVMACYTAAGAVWGTNPWLAAGVPVPAVIVGCNSAYAGCQATCAAVALSPTP
ncbi:cysteine-rich protein [Kalaharituber pfeilii]|nr:cysteine-rich protein [Kalaharituber pfeilii]